MQSIECNLYFPFIVPLILFLKFVPLSTTKCLQSPSCTKYMIYVYYWQIYIFYCPKVLITDIFSKSSLQLKDWCECSRVSDTLHTYIIVMPVLHKTKHCLCSCSTGIQQNLNIMIFINTMNLNLPNWWNIYKNDLLKRKHYNMIIISLYLNR